MVQSFFWRSLAHVQSSAPEITTSCLTSERDWLDNIGRKSKAPSPWTGLDVRDFGGSVPMLVKASGCAIWSPYYQDVNRSLVDEAHGLGLRVVAWTVNSPEQMKALIEAGVDGIITDYPDRLRRVAQALGLPVPATMPGTAPDPASSVSP